MDCPECARLLARRERLKAAHMVAFQEFRAGSALPIDEYRAVWAAVSEAWFEAEHARLELEQHWLSHVEAD
jgi:hypothetical protein